MSEERHRLSGEVEPWEEWEARELAAFEEWWPTSGAGIPDHRFLDGSKLAAQKGWIARAKMDTLRSPYFGEPDFEFRSEDT